MNHHLRSAAEQRILSVAIVGLMLTLRVSAVTPRPGEFLAAEQWAQRVFGTQEQVVATGWLKIRYEDVADGITRGHSWRGTPYQLGNKTYSHGIAFNSSKHIQVHLGRSAQRFTAEVGLENNDDTRRGAAMGQGSVTFHVLVGGKEVFTSPVRRLQDGALPISVPLAGADEFEIRVGDASDGRGWDQALWGDATVTLEDGTAVRLQDLPWSETVEQNRYGFSFMYDGKPSASLLGKWTRELHEEKLDGQPTRREVSFRDPDSGLEARAEAILFKDFPAVEWVVEFKNAGRKDTPLLESIQALDGVLPVPTSGPSPLHWAKGAVASFDDFAPQETELKPGVKRRLQPGGGRSSSQVMPFFNVEGAGAGVVVVIGWSGEWAAEFACDARNQVSLKAGMARTHLVLYPGETIRTPRMLLMCYEGDRWQGQNLLRQFVLAHHRPTRLGQPLIAPITCGNWGGTSAEIHLDNIRQIIQHQLPLDEYWIDAEWFGKGGWPENVGNWEVKRDLYPNGFKPLSDALRGSGRELMLWFEPERVFKGTPWHQAHKDWLVDIGRDSCLFNLGNTNARAFLTDFISSKVDEFGLGCYRQDFNMDPLPYWQAADAPDRQGMAEIRHIEGLYAFWDELRARHPGLIIDNCASGGRRIDLETIGRATPFWRTDGPRDPIAHQCHTYGLLMWAPLSATSQDLAGDNYEFRSSMCSGLCLNWWVSGDVAAGKIRPDFPFDWCRGTLEQYLKIRDFFYGDYYPLTSYSQARDVWMAYQLDRPESGKGLVVVLRRPNSPYDSARFPLYGLQPQSVYSVRNLDTAKERTYSGRDLSSTGLEVGLAAKPDSVLFLYQRK